MIRRLRMETPSRAALATTLALLLALPGCAYESSYVAPRDGRARPVWKGNDVTVELAGAPVSDVCLEQLRAWSGSGRLRLVSGDVKRDRPPPQRMTVTPALAFWVPIYFGPPIVAPAPGVVPILPPVLFVPHLAPPPLLPAPVPGGFGGLGGGGGNDLGKLLVVLAVVALIVLPIVDIAVAAATPENDRSSDAIDQVNVFNDLARWPGSPCAYAVGP